MQQQRVLVRLVPFALTAALPLRTVAAVFYMLKQNPSHVYPGKTALLCCHHMMSCSVCD